MSDDEPITDAPEDACAVGAPGSLADDVLARYRAILSSTLDPVVVIDGRGIVQDASDSIERVFGWRPGELVGRSVSDLMPEPHRSRHDGYLERYRRTGETTILGRPREFEAVRKDGSTFPIELCVSRAEVEGQEPLFVGIVRDITDRKRAERVWQESARRFREIMEGVELVAVTLDRDGKVVFCNGFLLRLTGWTREEVAGRDWFDTFVPHDQAEDVRGVFAEAIERGEVRPQHENEICTRDGERRLIAWNNAVVREPGGDVVEVTGLGVDITEGKRIEEELASHREHLEHLVAERTAELEASHEQLRLADRLATIGTLAAGVGHDMNNILLPIRCRLDALDAQAIPSEAKEHFGAVRKAVDYLQQLSNGLHLLALDADDTHTPLEGTVLPEWWEQVGPLLARGLPKTVRLATSWPSDLPPVAVAPHRLTQAVLNLVVNAGEAVGAEGKVRVWAAPAQAAGFVRLGVTDDGPGMAPEVRRRAFDPFFTTKKRGLGTGLGLSLVQGVVRSAGGSVLVDSAPGCGTTVLLMLPVHGGRPAAADGQGPASAYVTVGDARLASLVSMILEEAGLVVRDDGADAPEPGELWITDPTEEALALARRVNATGGVRILVLGEPPEAWDGVAPYSVPDPEDFELLRDGVRHVAAAMRGEHT